ncbi:g5977 [Coccomyxa viridis]|uniref:Reticulon-like protein n=1 Tax=Coccomyxa viridis TaxID=1274662 RepID=A0ABP1FU88_9CHLO
MSRRISLNTGNDDVEKILLWRDPVKSGIVLGGATLAYLLLEWSHFSLLSIVANTLLIAVSVAFLWNNIASFTGRQGVPVPAVVRHGISDNQMKSGAEKITGAINKLLAFSNRVFTGKEVVLSAQVAGVLFLIGKVGGWFTSLGLLYTLIVLAFTLPKAYELKKDEVDRFARQAQHHTKHNYSKYVEPYVNKIPRASTSTSSQAPTMPSNVRSSTATSSHTTPVMPSGMHATADPVPLSEPKKVI